MTDFNFLHAGKFFMIFLSSADIFQHNFFQEQHQRQLGQNVRPDLGPNCFQRSSADDKIAVRRQRV